MVAAQLLTLANACSEQKPAETLDRFAQLISSTVFRNLRNDQQSCLHPLPEM